MDLVARVLRALEERPVTPVEFERCACALLQARYPGLSAVEGGHDFGRDGDVYFPFGEGDTRSRGRLLATTGDPVENLRTGLRRMGEENVQVDMVVMACLRQVSATTRARLDRLCAEQGIPTPHVYGRDWLVAQLVREPVWRERLLGVRGELGALLIRPLEMLERSTPDSPALVGRDSERSLLESVIDAGRDVVLAGVPGVGKTRLVTELGRNVMFLQQADPGQVVDALVQQNPVAVVVDDVHSRLGDLRVLRQARVQEGLTFSIIAITWADRYEDVAAELQAPETMLVERLERPDMDALVQSVGVTGYRARALVLHQAEGRPGWALALCEVLLGGATREVASGTAHLTNVERFLRRATESEIALDALACVAALTEASPETVHCLAKLVGIPHAQLVAMLNRLARNGLLDQTRRGWSLQPALRPPLIAWWFFTEPAGRPWSTLVDAFPEHELSLTKAAITASRVGARGARATADAWAESVPEPADWDTTSCALMAEYATLDEHAARFAITHARAVLAADRPRHQLMGVDIDPVGRAMKELITQVARQWLLPEAVFTLLDLALNDSRLRSANPDHPLRVLGDLAGMIDPDVGTVIEIRERVLDSTLDWLTANPTAERWVIAAELIAAILSPEASGQWLDPGSPHTVTFLHTYEAAAKLERLVDLWGRVERALAAESLVDRPACPVEALAILVDLAGEWLQLQMGVGFGIEQVSEDQQLVGRAGAHRILKFLRPVIQAVPGLALRAQRLLQHAHLEMPSNDFLEPFDLDAFLVDFVGESPRNCDDIETHVRDQNSRIDRLAQHIAELGPAAGTARFAELHRQASLAGSDSGGHGDWIATQMRPHMADPIAWYRTADDQRVPALVRAASAQIIDHDPTALPVDMLTRHLHDPTVRPTIVSAVLARTDVDAFSLRVIANLDGRDVSLMHRLAIHQAPTEVMHYLLRHPVPAIAGSAALSFSVGQPQPHGPVLPENWNSDWANAVRNFRVDHMDQVTQWRAGRLLAHIASHEPDLFEQWFAQRLREMTSEPCLTPVEPGGCEHYLSGLAQPARERLARQYVNIDRPRLGQSLLTYLLGTDRELAERLLDEQVIVKKNLLEAITGQRDTVLEQLGPLLLDRGVQPEHIAACAGTFVGFRWGSDSTMHAEIFNYFTSLGGRIPTLRPVAEAGCAEQKIRRQEAEAQERQERIRGA